MHDLTGRRVLLVADALPTAAIAQLAARAVKKLGAKHVTFAVPACSLRILDVLPPDVDRTKALEVSLVQPDGARVYGEEEELSHVEAAVLLTRAASRPGAAPAAKLGSSS